MRDLCRARGDVVTDLDRARRRLGHSSCAMGGSGGGGSNWTLKHEQCLLGLGLRRRALASTFAHYRPIVEERLLPPGGPRVRPPAVLRSGPYADAVHRLCCYGGVDSIGALTLVSEVCDWRRFAKASSFMGFVGLVASEHSSGGHTQRGHITKAGNEHLRTQLVQSAWAYQPGPYVRRTDPAGTAAVPAGDPGAGVGWAGTALREVQAAGCPQERESVVAAAVARELAGFVWGEMTA